MFYRAFELKRGTVQAAMKSRKVVKKREQKMLATTKEELAGTKEELADTKEELADMRGELAGTKGELVDMRGELAEIRQEKMQLARPLPHTPGFGSSVKGCGLMCCT